MRTTTQIVDLLWIFRMISNAHVVVKIHIIVGCLMIIGFVQTGKDGVKYDKR